MAKAQVSVSPEGAFFGMQRCLSEELGSAEGAGLLCDAEKHKEFSPAVGLFLWVCWPRCLGDVLVVFGL